MPETLSASQLLAAGRPIRNATLTLASDGTLAAIKPGDAQTDQTTLTPACFDIHTHGAVGEDVMSATPGGFRKLGRFFARRGVAWYLPTTVTAAVDPTLAALDRIATEIERGFQPGEAQPLGIHLEGPFLSHAKRGVHPTEHLQDPSIELFERFFEAARGHILMLTLAPERPGAADLIRHAVGRGVRVSLGHTNATASETLAALDAGATAATHTFNAMRPLDHREPGVLGIVLEDERVFAELICDGVHVAAPVVRLWWRLKGPQKAVLVTDSMQATGLGPGAYTLGGLPVTVRDGQALLSADLEQDKYTLAGSVLTLDTAVSNLRRQTGATLAEAVAAASLNPAAMLGRPELVALQPGQPANLNRFDAQGQLIATYLHGALVPR